MTILEASVGLGVVVGSMLSSYALKAVGNVYLLLIVATLNVFAYVYTNIWIKESLVGAVQVGTNNFFCLHNNITYIIVNLHTGVKSFK